MEAFIEQAKPLCDGGPHYKELFDFIRLQHSTLKARASELEAVAAELQLALHGHLICCLYSIVTAAVRHNTIESEEILITTSSFLLACDAGHLRAAGNFTTSLCRDMVTIADQGSPQQMLRILRGLRAAVEKCRASAEVLTPIHCEYLRACLKAQAYHLPVPLLEEPIYDLCGPMVGLSGPTLPVRESNGAYNCGLSPKEFLMYWYYGALIWIGLKEFRKAQHMLMMALICPSQTLISIQVDAYKKFLLVGLKLTGEIPDIPKYASQCVHRLTKTSAYDLQQNCGGNGADSVDYAAHLRSKKDVLIQDGNYGLAKQVITALERRKVCELTKTYLTLSLDEIRKHAIQDHQDIDIESFLFGMVSRREIDAKLDQSNGIVSFQECDEVCEAQDVEISATLEKQLQEVLELSKKVAARGRDIFNNEKDVHMSSEVAEDTGAIDGSTEIFVPDAVGMEDCGESQAVSGRSPPPI
eukprot:GEMP01037285.1.p1 GENE.GEMP01037285.1~~GEMP01037285.1.p1  ORF type:complete len:479 (+),score=92.91 GEMP01037285.1:29-1438(+)